MRDLLLLTIDRFTPQVKKRRLSVDFLGPLDTGMSCLSLTLVVGL